MHILYELQPIFSHRQSFYGRAQVLEINDSIELYSYNTLVARIKNGKFEYLWNDYSATTGIHVKDFLQQHGFPNMSKQQILAHRKEVS